MIKRSILLPRLAAAALLAAYAAAPAAPARAALSPELTALQDGFAAAAAKAKPAVVHITTTQDEVVQAPQFFFGDPQDLFRQFNGEGFPPRAQHYRTEASGSGFIFDAKGYVITNDHVVHGAQDIRVIMTGTDGVEKSYPARLIGTDPYYDIAVVKITGKGPFPALTLGDSDKVRVGEWALAIGSPFGLGQTVTAGILSALHQSLDIEGRRYSNLIQTDAAINRGNSGGPLVDLDGNVIGINSAIYSPSGSFAGIGFALPINEAKDILDTLVAGKQSKHGWLGVEVAAVDDVIQKRFALPGTEGALINAVLPGAPAEKGGLKRGDVVVTFGGARVATPDDLARLAAETAVGARVKIGYVRDGKSGNAQVMIGQRPQAADEEAEEQPAPAAPKESAATFRWEGVEFAAAGRKAVVAAVSQESKLLGYLREQDVVQGVNQEEVSGIADLKRVLHKADLAEGVVFDVIRDGQPMFISVQAAK